MTEEQFAEFRHECVHDLMKLNDECDREFSVSEWPRWDFALEAATLTFSQDGLPKVVADIQVIGTTSAEQGKLGVGLGQLKPSLAVCISD
jgi:hypothetical protein